MSKFKINNIVEDDCGCIYKILKVGRKYYTCEIGYDTIEAFKFKIEIKELDNRAKLSKENLC